MYSKLIIYKNKLLVSTELDENKIGLENKAYYRLYQINKNNTELLKDSIYTNDKYVVEQMTDFDSLRQLEDKVFYVTYKNGKQGLLKYQLFGEYYDYYDQTYEFDRVYSSLDAILEPEYDFVYYSVHQDKSLSKKDIYYEIIESPDNDDAKTTMCLERIKSNFEYQLDDKFGFNQINDSLVMIYDFIKEQHEYIPLVGYYGDDSITVNEYGEILLVYPGPQPGEYHCGVYNLNQKSWILNN